MDIKLEHLELLPKILEKLEKLEKQLIANSSKRWMNTEELSNYLGYSKDRIYKIKTSDLIEGIHYHKKGKIIFDF